MALIGLGVLAVAGCGGARHSKTHRVAPRVIAVTTRQDPTPVPRFQALVTAQTEDRLLVVALPSGHVVRQVTVSGSPDYVAAAGSVVVVVSADSGIVTLLDRTTLRVIRVFRGFSSPHIPAISPDWGYAYVTDDGSGELSVIGLYDDKLLSRVFVGAGAHHLAFSPDERQVWVALGQVAQTVVVLSTADTGQPQVIGSFHPPFPAHDLLFTPSGKQVWITSADTTNVGVFSARTRRLMFLIPAGAPPQHLAFANGYAYITSGYGSSIEQVDVHTGRVLRRTFAPYGSFDLDAAGKFVVTASLLEGTLAIYDPQLRLLGVRKLAPSTEDVALSAG